MTDSILLTGAAGFIGSHVAERLLAAGASVVGVDNFDPFYDPAEKRANLEPSLAHDAYAFIEADCADPASLESKLDALPGGGRFDVVVHLAAKAGVRPSIEDPGGYVRANLVATQAMLDLARRRGIDRFVFGSSSSVYGNNEKVPFSEADPVDRPISPYAATKRAGELLCHSHHHLYGTAVHCLRFFTVYGPRQRPDLAIRKFATLMLRGQEIPMFGDGTTERDYTWVDDIVAGVEARCGGRPPSPASSGSSTWAAAGPRRWPASSSSSETRWRSSRAFAACRSSPAMWRGPTPTWAWRESCWDTGRPRPSRRAFRAS
jgi:UDP-glucuronate 4-epimerase